MAEIDRDRRGGAGWIGWVVGLVVLVLLVWWIWPDAETEEFANVDTMDQVEPAAEMEDFTPADTEVGSLPAAAILADPNEYEGRDVNGVVAVQEVAGPRAFWVGSQEQRLLVILAESDATMPPHVTAGQSVELRDAAVHHGTDLDDIENLDDTTRSLLQGQSVYLIVEAEDVHVAVGAGMDA